MWSAGIWYRLGGGVEPFIGIIAREVGSRILGVRGGRIEYLGVYLIREIVGELYPVNAGLS